MAIGTGIIGTVVYYCNYKISKLQHSIIDTKELAETKEFTNKTIIKGTVKGRYLHQPIKLEGLYKSKNDIVYLIYKIDYLDRSKRVISQIKLLNFIVQDIQLGPHTQVMVKTDNNTAITALLFYEKTVELDLTWWRYLFSFITSRIPCFSKTIIKTVPANQEIFVQGKITKVPGSNYCIEAAEIYTSEDDIYSELRFRRRNLLILLAGYSVSLILALVWRRSVSSWEFSHYQVPTLTN